REPQAGGREHQGRLQVGRHHIEQGPRRSDPAGPLSCAGIVLCAEARPFSRAPRTQGPSCGAHSRRRPRARSLGRPTQAGCRGAPPADPAGGDGVRDDGWFSELYRQHATAVYRHFVRRAPAEDAEDLAAEVLATAWRRRDDVPEGAELPWLYRTAGYVLAN